MNMWLIRFHKLEPRDYNMISRQLEKAWFSTRKISPIIFIKSSIEHILNKKSWRQISNNLPYSHIPLYNFYNKFKNTPEFSQILFTLANRRIILNIKGKNNVSQEYINNSEELLELTLTHLKDIVQDI
jgi:hypothetical protein